VSGCLRGETAVGSSRGPPPAGTSPVNEPIKRNRGERPIKTRTPQVFHELEADLGEGPLWDPETGRLYVVDINAPAVHVFEPTGARLRTYRLESRVGMAALTTDPRRLLVAQGKGLALLDLESGRATPFGETIEKGLETRLNDGKPGPDGSLYVGSNHFPCREAIAHFYRVDREGRFHRLLEGITVSNGIGWTPDRKVMYYTDSPTMKVSAYEFRPDRNALGKPLRTFKVTGAPLEPHYPAVPDGLTVDAGGNLWVAVYGAGEVQKLDPEGRLLASFAVGAPKVTSCVFGGPDLSTLYITTAREHMPPAEIEKHRLSGAIFALELEGVRGQEPFRFRL
jgi:sugar lactone lactonase YvrE